MPILPVSIHDYQIDVRSWMLITFGEAISANVTERNFRFLEEALELVQSLGCTKDDALRLVDYVFGRPPGDPEQELGGVMVTLAALSNASGLSMKAEAGAELARISTPEMIEKIRSKQQAKRARMLAVDVAADPLP